MWRINNGIIHHNRTFSAFTEYIKLGYFIQIKLYSFAHNVRDIKKKGQYCYAGQNDFSRVKINIAKAIIIM